METTKTARSFLGLNATFSALFGFYVLFASGSAADLMFAEPADWQILTLRILGGGLLIFAMDLIMMATNRAITKTQVLLISFMDAGWIGGSILLLMFDGQLFSEMGETIIIIVASFVAVFAIGQYIGAQKIVPPLSRVSVRSEGGTLAATVKRSVRAPKDVVWEIMTDHPRYADVASNLSKVEIVAGDGMGMQRRCYGPKGENWLETCDLFEDGHVFGFRIHTEAKDYPYPISELQGRWSVESKGAFSEFTINISARPKGNFLMRTLFKFVAKRQFSVVLMDLADGWADRMERKARG